MFCQEQFRPSQPRPKTRPVLADFSRRADSFSGGCSLTAEPQPSTLHVKVQFLSPAPDLRPSQRTAPVATGMLRGAAPRQVSNMQSRPERQRAYAEFLKSDFWLELRAKKLKQCPACSHCEATKNLEVHHHRYPANWYQTQLSDLTVLCDQCHEIEHGFQAAPLAVQEGLIPAPVRSAIHQQRSEIKRIGRRQAAHLRRLRNIQELSRPFGSAGVPCQNIHRS